MQVATNVVATVILVEVGATVTATAKCGTPLVEINENDIPAILRGCFYCINAIIRFVCIVLLI